MQNRPRLALAFGLALAAGLGAGFLIFVRRPAIPAPPTSPPARVSAADTAPTTPASSSSAATPDPAAEEARHLEAFLNALTTRHPFGRERQSVLRETLENAPPHAVEALLRVTFGDAELNDLTHVLIERLATLAPEAGLAFAREKQLGAEPPWWHSVLGGLADPRLAAADILALPASETRTGYLGHLALRIAVTDTAAALHFARNIAPAEARQTALANAILGAARQDPATGLALALAHGSETGDPGLARSLAVDWAMDDYAAARRHILSLPDDAPRQAALNGLAAVALDRDPDGAPALIALIANEDARQELLARLRPDH